MKQMIINVLVTILTSLLVYYFISKSYPRKTIISFFKDYKAQQFCLLNQYCVNGNINIDFNCISDQKSKDLLINILTDIKYYPFECTTDGKEATVTIICKMNNVKEMLEVGYEDAMNLSKQLRLTDVSKDEIDKKLIQTFFKPLYYCKKIKGIEAEIKLKYVGSKWLIDVDKSRDFINLIQGGLNNYM